MIAKKNVFSVLCMTHTRMLLLPSSFLFFVFYDFYLLRCVCFLLVVDEDSNGAIDHAELKKCFTKLEISFTEEEINDLFVACDINENMGMKFNEFIVLLCLVYLLKDDPIALHAVSRKYFLYVFPFT